LERSHLEKRVLINERLVKMNTLHYELQKQKFIMKSGIEDSDIEAQLWPFVKEINELRAEEGSIMESINDSVEELRIICLYQDEDY
jgi:hypothetical protein